MGHNKELEGLIGPEESLRILGAPQRGRMMGCASSEHVWLEA